TDLESMLLGGLWWLGNMSLFLKKWYPGFDHNIENINTIPIWCRLPRLPLQFWDDEILLNIAKSLGTPIRLDGPTRNRSKLAFACFCISSEMEQELPEHIILKSKYGMWIQKIKFETFHL
ncbi:hypothetical protein KI387_000080, partial [Taxus chinensis]